ncbi:hypothetical protein [Tritonibacter scottomollicae]|uniref:Transmembrane protein n=1 Tax=Tritonibacter scottomollicae TaxID=483013 RepID=A0A2T1A946_TRISK|nr:hypothetical protein [Tritonibacter scottomollicae]PRZ44997.1 hypothetical protein CLV89_1181 [Tritonibacter scottomollicae]
MTNLMITPLLTSWANRLGLIFALGWILIGEAVHILRLSDEGRGVDVLPYTVANCSGTCTDLPPQDTRALIEATFAAGENACELPRKLMEARNDGPDLRATLSELARALPIRIEASQSEITVSHNLGPLAWVGALPDRAQMARRSCTESLLKDPRRVWFTMFFVWGALSALVYWRFRTAPK